MPIGFSLLYMNQTFMIKRDASACLMSIFNNFENSTRFGVKTVMIINDIDSAFDGCSRALISNVLSHMGFGNCFISKLWNPYHLANATLLFNNLELNEIPVTSGTGQGDPLSGIAFMISALPALIKIQSMEHLYPYIHKLELVHDSDPIFNSSSFICQNHISET